MAWCRQTTGNYLNQCWPCPMSPGANEYHIVSIYHACWLPRLPAVPYLITSIIISRYQINFVSQACPSYLALLSYSGLTFGNVRFQYIELWCVLGAVSVSKCRLTSMGISMLKIRRSHDRLIFNMGIPITGKDGFLYRDGALIPLLHDSL